MSTLAQLREEHLDELVVAHVEGEVDASNVRWLGGRLRDALTNDDTALAVDLTRTSYLDSAAIALLFRLASELRTSRQELHLVVTAGTGVSRLLAISGLEHVVATHDSVPAAIAARGG